MIFVRSGTINMNYGFLGAVGTTGYYWPRNGAASTFAYYLYFDSSVVHPSNGPTNRYRGFSLCCLQEKG